MKLDADTLQVIREKTGWKNVTQKRLKSWFAGKFSQAEAAETPVAEEAEIQEFVLNREPSVVMLAPATPETTILQAQVAQLTAKLEELTRSKAEEDKHQAVAAGRLPAIEETPVPTPVNGRTLPRGVWFQAPVGPPVKMKLCNCPQCSGVKQHHYFCVACHRGPIGYKERYPGGRKMWMAPGSVWGVVHECCTPTCWSKYQEQIGIIRGVNDFQPVNVNPDAPTEDGEVPERRIMPIGSD